MSDLKPWERQWSAPTTAPAGKPWEREWAAPAMPAPSTPPAPPAAASPPGPSDTVRNVVQTVVSPLVNMADYPIRATAADIVGLVKGGVPISGPSRESFNKEREKSLEATVLPESATAKKIEHGIGSALTQVGRYTPPQLALRALGIEDAAAPFQTMAGDALGLVGFSRGGVRMPVTGAGKAMPLSRGQAMLKDFESAGVTPNAPTVGQGRAAGLATQITSYLPATGEAVRGALERTTTDTAASAERSATGFGPAMAPEQTGGLIHRGIDRFAKNVFPERAEELYGNFDRLMAGAQPVPVTNTLASLEGPMKRFPTSPELGAQLTNPQLRAYAGTLAPKETETPALFSTILDASGQPILLKAAEKVKSGGSLTFDELKELRSTIGRKLGDPVLVSDIPRADLKTVYAGISRDMEAAAQRQGPEALQAFKRASAYYKAGLARIDRLEPLLSGPPERALAKINAAAGEGASADAGLLRTVKKSVDPQEWRQVGAAVIRRLGEPTKGAKDILAPTDFSPSSFSTNWNKLSPAAKDVLFGADVPDTPRAGLETLSRVVQAEKNLGRLANVSKSAEHGITFGLAFEAMRTLAYQPLEAAGIAAGAAGAYGMAKILMSPGFAKWLYRLPQVAAAETHELASRLALTSLLGLLSAGHPDAAEPRRPVDSPHPISSGLGISAPTPIPKAAPI